MNVAIIPARGGSKRVLRKNMRNLRGKPLVAWTIEAALASVADLVLVSTDDDEIEAVALEHGATAIRRPAALASDHAPMRNVVAHCADWLAGRERDWTRAVLLPPTSPARGAHRIDEAFAMLDEHDSVVSVVSDPMAYFAGRLTAGRFSRWRDGRPRTQDIGLYRENGALWAFSRYHWDVSGDYESELPAALVMAPEESADVNTEWDLVVAVLATRAVEGRL